MNKSHIFKPNSNYTFCGRHSVDIGSLEQYSDIISEKTIAFDRSIICESCLKNLRNKRKLAQEAKKG